MRQKEMKDMKFKGRDIDTILDILWEIKNDDKHYFYSYGRDCLKQLVKESDSLPNVSICHCDSKDWIPFRIEQRVLCGKCDKPIVG